jgi:predicted histidine transporter YuiF (NhaC family)
MAVVAGIIMAEAEEVTMAAAATTADAVTALADITAGADSGLDSDSMAPHITATAMRPTVTVIAARLDIMIGGVTGFRIRVAPRIPIE